MTEAGDSPDLRLLRALCRGTGFPHPVDRVEIVETHISRVFLTGEWAYKLKRPVAPGFLDFTTLERRRVACEEEIRLNRRLAPELYDAVLPITGTPDEPRIAGDGEVIEWCVRMRQFPADALMTEVLRADGLDGDELADFGRRLASFHEALPAAPADGPYGGGEALRSVLHQTLGQIRGLIAEREDVAAGTDACLAELDRWAEERLAAGSPLMGKRLAAGCVRECHGDLHLGNLVRLSGRIVAFDALEFDPALRWTDVLYEAAFLLMDLAVRGRRAEGFRFLNAWLQGRGDYDGLPLLPLYLGTRALVRAKVRLLQTGSADAQAPSAEALLRYAADPLGGLRPRLVLMCGVSGSGKSWLAERLAPRLGAVHARSDVERKRLAGLPALARTGSAPGGGLYDKAAGDATYARLGEIVGRSLAAGLPVIADATNLTPERRAPLIEVARRAGAAAVIVRCRGAREVIEARIRERDRIGRDPSEADERILASQLESQRPPASGEADALIEVGEVDPGDIDALATRIEAVAPEG